MKRWLIALFSVWTGLLLLQPLSAEAVDTYWQAGTGDWSTGTNWNNGEPSSINDNAYVNNGGTVQITQAGEIFGNLYLGQNLADNGNAMLSDGGHLFGGEQVIGWDGMGSFVHTGGTNELGVVTLGFGSESNGSYELSGAGQLSAATEVIGGSGTGTFSQTAGTNTVDLLTLAEFSADSFGTYELSGTGQLSVDSEEWIGRKGTGTFTQTGGTHTVGSGLNLGRDAGSSGTYELVDGQLSAAFEVIGWGGVANFMHTGGTNTVTGRVYVGYNANAEEGANATYELSGTGELLADSEWIGKYDGTFTQTGGSNTVSGEIILGSVSGGDGMYAISGGILDVGGSVYVGDLGTGKLTVTGDDPLISLAGFTQNANGTLDSQFDTNGIATINVFGTATLDGTWNVIDLGSAPLGVFDILKASGGISIAFDTVNLPNANWSWGINSGVSDTLWVEHVPEPATLGLVLVGGLALLRRRCK